MKSPQTFYLPTRGLCAHRGARATHPENTLTAFREAIRMGAHMIEFDINFTSDKRIILMHDDTVDRTTNGKGRIADLTFAEMRALDAGSWKHARFAGEQVPTLAEALSLMPWNVWINVHTKGDAELAAAAAAEIARQKRACQAFIATSRGAATAARTVCPDILVCNMENQGHHSAYVTETIDSGAAFIQLHSKAAAPEDMARLKAAGVRINCFVPGYKPDTPAELEALFAAGIEFPLIDNLEPMFIAARKLGIEPLLPQSSET